MDALSKNKIKWIRSLRLKKNRDSENLFVAEGAKIVLEIIKHWPDAIECFVTTDSQARADVVTYHADSATMNSLTSLKTPSSMLAVVRKPTITDVKSGFILAVDGIQDPGNMGTIIRTADWFGVAEIICSKETVDCFNSKVIQSTMGSIFRIPIRYVNLDDYLASVELPIYGALLEGKSMHEYVGVEEGILIMGNEGNGISDTLLKRITQPIHIPGKGSAESLNVAVATGILLGQLTK